MPRRPPPTPAHRDFVHRFGPTAFSRSIAGSFLEEAHRLRRPLTASGATRRAVLVLGASAALRASIPGFDPFFGWQGRSSGLAIVSARERSPASKLKSLAPRASQSVRSALLACLPRRSTTALLLGAPPHRAHPAVRRCTYARRCGTGRCPRMPIFGCHSSASLPDRLSRSVTCGVGRRSASQDTRARLVPDRV